jgi:hypothetical protein
LISALTFIEGRTLKQPIKENKFIPDYLGEHKQVTSNKTLEEQQQEFSAFHAKLKSKQVHK